MTRTLTFDDFSNEQSLLGINLYDINNSGAHFYQWCNALALPKQDSLGKEWSSSQIFFNAYQEHPEGKAKKPPYFNFWHFCLDWGKKNNSVLMMVDENLIPDDPKPQDTIAKINALMDHHQVAEQDRKMYFEAIEETIMHQIDGAYEAQKFIKKLIEKYGPFQIKLPDIVLPD